MRFTVLGSGGFIGDHLARHLIAQGYTVGTPTRAELPRLRGNLGHLIYCIGLTADFRHRPFDTVRAHVSVLADVLERTQFESFLYLSSSRVYGHSASTVEESPISVAPANPSDLYNLTKLAGESICLQSGRAAVRIARLSNVVGYDPNSENFLSSLMRDAVAGKIVLRSSLRSAKDYISLDDVLSLLPRIATVGKASIYNVARGRNTTNGWIVNRLKDLTGCKVERIPDTPMHRSSVITIDRIRQEFDFTPSDPLDSFSLLLRHYRNR